MAESGPLAAGGTGALSVAFMQVFVRQCGWQGGLALALLLLAGLSEGLSLLLFIPALELAGLGTGSLPTGGLRPLLDRLPLPQSLAGLLAVCLALILVRTVLMRLKTAHLTRLMLAFTDAVRMRLFRAVSRARWSALGRIRPADINHMVTTDVMRIEGVALALLQGLNAGVMIAVYLSVSLLLAPQITAIVLGIGAGMFAVLYPLRRRAVRSGMAVGDGRRALFRTLTEFLGSIKVARSFQAEDRYIAEFERVLERMRADTMAVVSLQQTTAMLFQCTGVVALCAILYAGATWLALGGAQLAILIVLYARLSPLMTQLQTGVQQFLVQLPSFAAAQSMARALEAAAETAEPPVAADLMAPPVADQMAAPARLRPDIRFDAVGFHYPGAPPVLRDLSVHIPAHQITAIIGPSGSGKTTIADLLMGFIEPAAGAILIDGKPLTPPLLPAWRRQVAYVPQEAFLLHASIRANLHLAVPAAGEAALWEALDLAAAGDFVRQLPHGLDTVVGERGTRLSGGERQRIALARALLRRPGLLILDEATSALDAQSQASIARSIGGLRGRTTVVTIAHRLSMMAFADQVVVIEAGRVTEAGSFAALAGRDDGHLARVLRLEQAPPQRAGHPEDSTSRLTERA
ncbi:ABC transporter ATP-binding protein [Oleisolibacter albus]|uniref:ABC transporter ATP-binding protein n=1 Tax=Oleisolibacter albus TaxID=2171757 RepID=UPI00138FB4F4|nr:ABC transporter ATP-binding protein [Oleisolibacter albus]